MQGRQDSNQWPLGSFYLLSSYVRFRDLRNNRESIGLAGCLMAKNGDKASHKAGSKLSDPAAVPVSGHVVAHEEQGPPTVPRYLAVTSRVPAVNHVVCALIITLFGLVCVCKCDGYDSPVSAGSPWRRTFPGELCSPFFSCCSQTQRTADSH